MRKYLLTAELVVVTLAIVLLLGHFRAFGQAANSTDPIYGTWQMDVAKSFSHRADESPTFATQHMRILAPDGDGLRNSLYMTPTSAPSYSYSAKLDGIDHPDPLPGGKDRTLAHWHLAPDLIVRLQKKDGKPSEWVIYAVSSDGQTFTSISWVPNHPELQDIQVFTRANK